MAEKYSRQANIIYRLATEKDISKIGGIDIKEFGRYAECSSEKK